MSGEWDYQLKGHPDTVYTQYLVRGIRVKSTEENPGVIEEYLARGETGLGDVPLEPGEYP